MLFKLIAIALSSAFIIYCVPPTVAARLALSERARVALAVGTFAAAAILIGATISVCIEVHHDFQTADPAVVWQRIQQMTEARNG